MVFGYQWLVRLMGCRTWLLIVMRHPMMGSVTVARHAHEADGGSQNVEMHTALLLVSEETHVSRRSRASGAASATGFQLLSLFDDDGVFERIGASYGRER
jgi:hypothetical protein